MAEEHCLFEWKRAFQMFFFFYSIVSLRLLVVVVVVVGGLQEASGLLFAPLGKKKIKSTHERSHCVRFKPSSQHLSGFVCIFTIVHFPKFLGKRHVRFGAIYWLMLSFQILLQSGSFLPSEKTVLELIVAQNYW